MKLKIHGNIHAYVLAEIGTYTKVNRVNRKFEYGGLCWSMFWVAVESRIT